VLELTHARSVKALLAGLSNGEVRSRPHLGRISAASRPHPVQVRLYNDKLLIASLQINEPLTALRFGCYGREVPNIAEYRRMSPNVAEYRRIAPHPRRALPASRRHLRGISATSRRHLGDISGTSRRYLGDISAQESALIAVTTSGSLVIKMLQRQADLDGAGGGAAGPPPEQVSSCCCCCCSVEQLLLFRRPARHPSRRLIVLLLFHGRVVVVLSGVMMCCCCSVGIHDVLLLFRRES
jgi:hypothetical protein